MISRLCAASTARKRTSSSAASASSRTRTGISVLRYVSVLPASCPNARRHSAGSPASARIEQKTPPTTPRAPATPTVGHPFMQRPYPMARNLRHAHDLMPEREGFPAGVPAWIDSAQPDVDAAIAFYGGLFGWQFDDRAPSDSDDRYVVATLDGKTVAAIASPSVAGHPSSPAWTTYVAVDSADGRCRARSRCRRGRGRRAGRPIRPGNDRDLHRSRRRRLRPLGAGLDPGRRIGQCARHLELQRAQHR